MSDLCMYEFEDTVWNEFYLTDDHTVPHPGFEQVDNHSILGVNHKKPCRDETGDRRAPRYVDQGTLSKRRNLPVEKDSLSHRKSGVFPSSETEPIKASRRNSDNTRSSCHGSEFCEDTTLSGTVSPVDANSFDYPLGDITKAGSDLNLLENTDDKGSSDFFNYNWPEIGNFEDVDMIFRGDDSTFGLGDSKDDELGWFSSVDDTGRSGDLMKSDFQFPSPEPEAMEILSENCDSSKWYSANDSSVTSGLNWYRDPSWASETSDPYVSFVNGTAMDDSKDGFVPEEQMNMHKKHYKLQNQSMEKPSQFQPFTCDPGSVVNQCQFSGNECNAIEGAGQVVPVKLGSLNSPEKSTSSSGPDDISLEASSFHQLRLVMEQLDMRTKLCMKDSLYRLARSAEQRSHHANFNGGFGDEADSNGALMAEGTIKCANFLDVETDTNPIDRSIAHLLFHRPSETSAQDSLQVHSPSAMNFDHSPVNSASCT